MFVPDAQLDQPLQEQIETTLGNKSVFFVQIGSNDGIQGDPLHDLIIKHADWQGIFVEPVKYVFERLKRNYANSTRFVFENVAIGKENGRAQFYHVAERTTNGVREQLPYWYDQLGSFDRGHILRHLDGRLEPYIIEEEIKCISLPALLERNNVAAIDLLHVDAEGFDYEVIAQFPFERFRPYLILFEHKHLTADEKEKARRVLTARGYNLFEINGDTLAKLNGE